MVSSRWTCAPFFVEDKCELAAVAGQLWVLLMGLQVNMIIIYGEVTEYVIHPQYGQFCSENDDQLSNLFNFGVLVRYVQTSQKKEN